MGDLALGAVQIINLEQEALLDLENKYVLHRETPQWIKDDLTGTRDNVQAVIGFAGDLIKRDPKAWKAVYKGIEDSASEVIHNIATGNTFEIGGYVFDVATLVGPTAVGKLKYVDEASNLAKLAEAGEVASTVGKVEDGVKVGKEINRELKIINTNKFTKSGKEIVKVPKDISPSIQAKSWQGTGMYPGVDDYVDIKLVKGDKVYILESDYEVANNTHSGYATTFEAVKKSSYDSQKLSKSLQIMPYYDTEAEELSDYAEYRIKVTEYTVSNDLVAAYGEKTIANPQFGSGGAPQYFIKDIENKISLGQLKRGKSMPLHNHKISVDEYNAMIDSIY
ncbi:hypothetical protein [Streptococcus equinus]|uniref:hypothetical protein n=1 Tax=Streptococcus equinus TaxID=1335 RepID=UPI00215AFD2F|nr:hypothetical protein [Streptococcus equinus]UVF02985.1 hypothetical protein KRG72_01380 [Streptococcus equinus]